LQPSTLAKRGSILLFIVFILFYFYGLGQLPFIGPDEPRYAQVAREMFLQRDLITPTLGGYLWFEKPALLYWMTIVAFKLFGVSEWSARAVGAICGLLTVAAVFWIGKRTSVKNQPAGDVAFWSALVAGTSAGLIAFSRAVSFDIVVTMTIAWALAFFFAAELEADEKLRRRCLVGLYFAIGLSLIAKGLVGFVIPIGVISAYYTLRGKTPARDLRLSAFWGIPLALIVAASWYGPMFGKHGTLFFDEFIIKHHFERFATNKYHHPGAIYYYLLILPLLALPWSALLVDGLLKARKLFWKGSDDHVSRLQTFALAWILFPLIFFSFSSSKLPGYVLPVLPAVALLVGSRLAQLNSESRSAWAFRATGALGLAGAIALLVFTWYSGKISIGAASIMAALSAAAGVVALLSRREKKFVAVLLGAVTLAIVLVALSSVAPGIADAESSRRLIQVADERGYAHMPLFGLQRDDRSPEFYGAGRVIYGADHEPVMYDGIGQVIYESHLRRETILFLIPVRDLESLRQAESLRTEAIANNGRVAIVAVTPR